MNPNYIWYLRNMSLGRPYMKVEYIDAEDPACFAPWPGKFDPIICLNVLEHVRDPDRSLKNMAGALEPGGRLLLYVPQHQGLYSSLDEVRFGVLGWWWNGIKRKRRNIGRVQMKGFNAMIPLLRSVDRFFPWSGLGLLAVARRS